MRNISTLARISWLFLTPALLASCSSVKYVPIETIKRDTTYISKIKVDSAYVRDSIYLQLKGDTVIKYKERYHVKFCELHDTIWRERVDSIPVTVEVEKRLSNWQQFKVDYGGWAFLLFALLLINRLKVKLG